MKGLAGGGGGYGFGPLREVASGAKSGVVGASTRRSGSPARPRPQLLPLFRVGFVMRGVMVRGCGGVVRGGVVRGGVVRGGVVRGACSTPSVLAPRVGLHKV